MLPSKNSRKGRKRLHFFRDLINIHTHPERRNMIMDLRRFFCFPAALLLGLALVASPAWAEERIMQLSMPGCGT